MAVRPAQSLQCLHPFIGSADEHTFKCWDAALFPADRLPRRDVAETKSLRRTSTARRRQLFKSKPAGGVFGQLNPDRFQIPIALAPREWGMSWLGEAIKMSRTRTDATDTAAE